MVDELVRRHDDDEPVGSRLDELLPGVGGAAALDEPAVGRHLVGPVDREVEPGRGVRAGERDDVQAELARPLFGAERRRDARQRRRPCGERVEEERHRRPRPEAHSHPRLDQSGGCFGHDPLLVHAGSVAGGGDGAAGRPAVASPAMPEPRRSSVPFVARSRRRFDRLELWEPDFALETVDEFLRSHGFFRPGGEGLVADLHLGYGLSETIRRQGTPAPPEPCSLPLAVVVVREGDRPARQAAPRRPGRFEIGPWRRTWRPAEYAAAVGRVREAIARGDVYQVSLVQHLAAPFAGDPRDVAHALAPLLPIVPEPLAGDGWTIVSATPELFLARRGRRVWTAPIKGTRPAGHAAELSRSEKDAAEHLMIVDLERNDLSRVCEPGSVRWPELMATRRLAGVEHMVSTVEGTLREDVTLAEILRATFPGGSITGAPKIAAVDLIASLEPVGRGAAMGALGTVRGNGDFDLALTIRTFAIAAGQIHLWVGGGIVWDSDPAAEVRESLVKAAPLLRLLGAPLPDDGRPGR